MPVVMIDLELVLSHVVLVRMTKLLVDGGVEILLQESINSVIHSQKPIQNITYLTQQDM